MNESSDIRSRSLRPLRCVIALACAILLFAPALAAQSDRMVKYSNAQVRLYTDIGATQAKDVMDRLVLYKSFIEGYFAELGLSQKKKNPIRCYLYAKEEDFLKRRKGEFDLGEPESAYYSPSNNRIIAFYDDGSRRAYASLLRQCARPLVRRFLANTPPAWLEEGFACYFEGHEFDPHGNLISTCNDFSRVEVMREMALNDGYMDWQRFFDERPLPLNYDQKFIGHNMISTQFSAQAWGIIFFYLETDDVQAKHVMSQFIKGMNTGRVRSDYLMEDLDSRLDAFTLFVHEKHEEILKLYWEAEVFRADADYDKALKNLLKILGKSDRHVAALRLAGEVALEAGKYDASLSFWRMLNELDPKNTYYCCKICRCLVYTGLVRKNSDTLLEAVETGKRAVKESKSRDPECLAALAAAYNAVGKPQEALRTIRKAVWIGGSSADEYKALEKTYSDELRNHYRGSK
jgi:tetratricopeptide (TPR) repeat protein